jgi:hypothetical protein
MNRRIHIITNRKMQMNNGEAGSVVCIGAHENAALVVDGARNKLILPVQLI